MVRVYFSRLNVGLEGVVCVCELVLLRHRGLIAGDSVVHHKFPEALLVRS